MLVGNNIYTKFFSPLIKILCIITIIFSYSNISLSALQTISFTPILFFFGMVLFRWYQFLFSTKKVFYGIILDFLFSVVIILFIIFGYTIIYLNFIIIILDILFNL